MMTQKPQINQEIIKQFINVINSQAKLIDKLLHNQKHLVQKIRAHSAHESSSLSSSAFNKQIIDWYNIPFQDLKPPSQSKDYPAKLASIKKNKLLTKLKQRNHFQSQILEEYLKEQSDQSYQSEYKQMKIPETKNVIKNFSKSLFRFIQKHRVYVSRVLQHLNIKEEEFQKVFLRFRGKIYTIVDLKLLWMQQGNKFDQAFRIISLEYIRKHSLNHIFNSRVKNYKTHIKYRIKMEQILKNPNEFNSIKYD